MRLFLSILFSITLQFSQAQVLGGNSTFTFLKLSNTPQLTALGGIHISGASNDVGMAFKNPALLKSSMHTQLNAVFNDFYAGINTWHLSFGYHHPKWNMNFAGGLHYFDYGKVTQTDPLGNIMGYIRPVDQVMQISASKKYLQRWNYGVSLKFINSRYGTYRSSAIAMDFGLKYSDTINLICASVLVTNLGTQLENYAGAGREELPFDLQLGITKKLKHAPLSFSLTAHHLHQFNIRYDDTLFNNDNGIENDLRKFSFDKIFRHIVLSAQVYPVPQVELSVGYNHLTRKELNVSNAGNGLNGFSIGVGAIFKKIQIRYARAHYQNNTGNNQLGLNLTINELFGLGW